MRVDSRGLLQFDRLGAVAHAFAPRDALGGFDAARPADRERLRALVAPAATLVATHQTHSAAVGVAERAPSGARVRGLKGADCDGLVAREPDLLLHAISADCPLLFLALPNGAGVGVAHCGWRGVARGIVGEAVARLAELAGAAPAAMRAAISPGASVCCYEVGEDVERALAERGVDVAACTRPFGIRAGRPSRALDLKAAIAELLVEAGLERAAIEVAAECSICGGERFHSYRQSGAAAGRMSGVAALRGR